MFRSFAVLVVTCALAGATASPARGAPHPSPLSVDAFAAEALSVCGMFDHPLLAKSANRKAGLIRSEVKQHLSTISAGYTSDEIATWLHLELKNLSEKPTHFSYRMSDFLRRHPDSGLVAYEAIGRANDTSAIDYGMSLLYEAIPEKDWPIEFHGAPTLLKWFIAVVESPYLYFLGHPEGRALDLVLFLKSLQETGAAKDDAGRIIAVLQDERGEPYPHLLFEYDLHEILERTSMKHGAIIELTTRLFNYGIYRHQDENAIHFAKAGTRYFERAGQTPLGRALRMFIQWRFSETLAQSVGSRIPHHFTLFDPSFQSVGSARATITEVIWRPDGGGFVRLRHHGKKSLIALERIVKSGSLSSISPGTFADSILPTADQIQRHLDAGFSVTLTEPQVRVLAAVPSLHATAINRILKTLCWLRDAEGRHLRSKARQDDRFPRYAYAWAYRFSAYLLRQGFMLSVDMMVNFNDPEAQPFSLVRDAVSKWIDAHRDRSDDIEVDVGRYILRELLTYRIVRLVPLEAIGTTDPRFPRRVGKRRANAAA